MDARLNHGELSALYNQYADEGFTLFKTKVGNRYHSEEAARVGEVRSAIADESDLFVNANQAWTVTKRW